MRWFALGVGIFIIEVLVALILQDWSLLIDMSGAIGLSALFLAAISSGALVTGDRFRANYSSDLREAQQERRPWSRVLFLIGLPNLGGSLIAYLLLYR